MELLDYSVDDQVGRIVFTRPEARNALGIPLRTDLAELIPIIRADRNLKAIIISGSGGVFCAGGDLKSLSSEERPPEANRDRVALLHTWFIELCNLELPVIAAVDGPAYGAGFHLALACDFIVASSRTRFCAVFNRIGLVPDLGGLYLLPRIVGLQRAKELYFTARSFGADEAKSLGIVMDIFPPEELEVEAMKLARRFQKSSTMALGQTKRILNQSFHNDQRTLADMEAWAQSVCLSSSYHKDAVRRFLSKEPLEFNWDRMNEESELR